MKTRWNREDIEVSKIVFFLATLIQFALRSNQNNNQGI